MTGAPPPPPPPPPPSSPSPSASWGWEPPTSTTGTATTPAGVPPATPGAPAPKARKRWIVVLAVALGLIIAIAIAGTVLFVTVTLPPLSATYDFTNDLHDGNTGAAYAQVCDRLRTPGGRVGFNGFARRIASAESVSVDIFSVDRNGDTATVEFTSKYGTNTSSKTTLKLVHEHGDWRPCGTV
jgi:hypothetical protein